MSCTLHLRKVAGEGSHHILEGGVFKASQARSLKQAVALTGDDDIPPQKEVSTYDCSD